MRWIRLVQGFLIVSLAISLPAAALTVFAFDVDRGVTGDAVTVVFLIVFVSLLSTPWWPTAEQRERPRFESLQGMVMIWFGVTFTTHLTWELGWVLLRESIIASPDAIWSYPWWAYIDGGDLRYAEAPTNLVTMEILSVTNGLVGATGLTLWLRSNRTDARGVLLCMATAVVHIYSTSLYYGSEILDGLPNVDTSSFLDSWIKFGLANAPWIVFPWFVLYWGQRTLKNLPRR